jgi:hypothetical protein
MSYIVFDYLCEACDLVEERVTRRDEVEHQICQTCGGSLIKLPAAPKLDWKMGVDPDFATFGDRWARIQKQKAEKAKKQQGV